jgi:pimeloyl-ACP methyl ester carboxylesterase
MIELLGEIQLADLRFGAAPLPDAAPGFIPALDATALVGPGYLSPAQTPVPGRLIHLSLGPGQRTLLRIPEAWNGKLLAAGTPATRSEFANDLVFGETALAGGYAFVSSNKGIAYNAVIGPDDGAAATYPAAFAGPYPEGTGMRLGALDPEPSAIERWDADYAEIIAYSREELRTRRGREPERTYAVGLSNGGAQVRSLLERHPDLVDGGLDWAGVGWSPARNLLTVLPAFIAATLPLASGGEVAPQERARLLALGFPPDRRQNDAAHPSLWRDHLAWPPFYCDVTTFVYAQLLDAEAPPLRTLESRIAYRPSAAATERIARLAPRGRIGRPLVAIAGSADILVPPAINAHPYLAAIVAAGEGARAWFYEVESATHVDAFAGFGYGLVPLYPFATAALEQLVAIVERGARPPGAGTVRTVRAPSEIGAP